MEAAEKKSDEEGGGMDWNSHGYKKYTKRRGVDGTRTQQWGRPVRQEKGVRGGANQRGCPPGQAEVSEETCLSVMYLPPRLTDNLGETVIECT